MRNRPSSTAGAGAEDRRRDDRRAGQDRRTVANRRKGRRRRETPTPYSAEQITAIKSRFAAAGPVTCPACGSHFTLGPPRRRGAEIARRVMCLGCSRGAVVPHSRQARVLLVHPHPLLRDTLQAMLAEAGHEVVEVTDCAVALVAYQTVPADVVIIDVSQTGRLEAPDFLRRLRRGFPDARVITMARRPSYRETDPLALTQGLGAVRALRMPISREDLLKAVEDERA